MRNLAIIIGVSQYINAQDLPACKYDAENMYELLQATEKYQILLLDENLTKSQMMEQMENFIGSDDMDGDIDELFFYFSGHGVHDEAGLHFVLKDTEPERINATSLNNIELDELVRDYNPKLFVKIMDACQSGLSYIKSVAQQNDMVEEQNLLDFRIEKKLDNCIFMSSSKRNEASIATPTCSLFTKAFISAVLDTLDTGVVRYTDIQNYITDVFVAQKNGQTPYFNLQGDGRSVFTHVTEALKNLAKKYAADEDKEAQAENSLSVSIDRFLSFYRSDEDVKKIVHELKNIISEEVTVLDDFEKYYTIQIINPVERDFQEDKGIVNFLYKRRHEENLYVEFETERVRKENYFNIPMWGYDTCPVSFSSMTYSLPSSVAIQMNPKKDGLPKYEISIVFIYSDVGMYVFFGVNQRIYKGWKEYVIGERKKYSYRELKYAEFDSEEWKEFFQKRLEEGRQFIEKTLGEFVARG